MAESISATCQSTNQPAANPYTAVPPKASNDSNPASRQGFDAVQSLRMNSSVFPRIPEMPFASIGDGRKRVRIY